MKALASLTIASDHRLNIVLYAYLQVGGTKVSGFGVPYSFNFMQVKLRWLEPHNVHEILNHPALVLVVLALLIGACFDKILECPQRMCGPHQTHHPSHHGIYSLSNNLHHGVSSI